MRVRCSTQPESPLARIRRQSPRVSPSCTRVFGPIEAMIRDWRVGFDRTMAQFRATDVTHSPRVFDRAVDFGAGAARAVVARDGGAFAMARGVDLEAGARAVGGVVARARAGAGALDAVGLGGLATGRGATFSAGRSVTGSDGGAAGASTAEGVESLCTTVPADCIATRLDATTGVGAVGSVSTVDRAIALSCVESVRATAVESRASAAAVSGCANVIFRPNDSVLG